MSELTNLSNDALCEAWLRVEREKYNLAERERELLGEVQDRLNIHESSEGTFKLVGETLQATVRARQNVNYPGGGLTEIVESFRAQVLPMLRVSYRESGKKVANFLCVETSDPDMRKLQQAIKARRKSNLGKLAVDVERVNADTD